MKTEKLQTNVIMAPYTTWKVGGISDYLYQASTIEDVQGVITRFQKEPIYIIGNGSNVLVRDKGLRGVALLTKGGFDKIEVRDSGVYAQTGANLAKLVLFSVKQGFAGIEFLAGIPGTVGGALRMNAGSFGKEIWDWVEYVKVINREGVITKLTKKDFSIGYRSVNLAEDHYFLSAKFNLAKGEVEERMSKMTDYLMKRKTKQPNIGNSCGSVFKNPKDDYAGRLIEACGLKGHRVGGAVVSKEHANFIINDQNATSKNIEDLISFIQEKVSNKFNVLLRTEVLIIGEK